MAEEREKQQPLQPGDEAEKAPREEKASRAGEAPASPAEGGTPPSAESVEPQGTPEGEEGPPPEKGASPEEEAALFEGNPGAEELHQALDAVLPEEGGEGGGEKKEEKGREEKGREEKEQEEEKASAPPDSAREAPAEEDEEDYEFDLEGISLDDPSEAEEEEKQEEREPKEGPAPSPPAGAGPGAVSPPGEDPWPEDEKEGTPLFALAREKLAGIPRRKLAFWAVLFLAPLFSVLLLGLPTRKIEKVLPTRIPEPRSANRRAAPPEEIPPAVPGYIPPVVREVRPLPPRAKDRPPLWAAAEQKARAGDYAGAIILLEKFLAGNPPLSPEEKSGAWYDLSRWYRKVGDKEASRKYFSMALDTTWSSLGPKDLLLGGLELHKAGKYRQARRYFAAFLLQEDLMVPELKKKIAQAWYLLAEGYRLEAEAGEKAQERREEALQDAAGGAGEEKR